MSIVGDLTTYLRASTAVTAVVATRIHHNVVPQDASRPYIWFRRVSENEELTMDGVGGLVETDIDLECWAATDSAADGLANLAKARLNGVRGAFGTATVGGVFVRSKDDEYLPRGAFEDTGMHVVALGVKIWHDST